MKCIECDNPADYIYKSITSGRVYKQTTYEGTGTFESHIRKHPTAKEQ